jgi:hypothetical protein
VQPIQFRIRTIIAAIALVALYMGIVMGIVRWNPNIPCTLLVCLVLQLPLTFLYSRLVRPRLSRCLRKTPIPQPESDESGEPKRM